MATSNFPSSLDTTSALPASISDTANLNSPNHADMHEVTNDAIIEIEEKLGTGDTTASTGAVLIGTGSGASAWDTSPTFVGAVTVGEDDTGHDVKFYGATASSYFEWDESADSLILKNSSVAIQQDNGYPTLQLESYNDTEAATGRIVFYKADGTKASPQAVDDNATLGQFRFYGYDGNSWAYGAFINVLVDGTPGDGDIPTEMQFGVTPDGSETPATALTIKPTGNVFIAQDLDVDGTLETDAFSINGTAVTSTAAELNILDGCTATYTELNIMDGVTATTAEINYLDNADLTAADLTKLAAINSTAAELNILDGVVATAAELNTVADVTLGTVAANKAVTVDANKDVTGFRHLTMTGDLDVDGTTDLDAVDVDGVLTVTDGSAGAPAIAFGSDTDSGVYLYSTGNISVATAGSRRANFGSGGFYSIKSTVSSGYTVAGWNSSTGNLVNISSSERYKENIGNLPKSQWEKVYQLQAREFDWKDTLEEPPAGRRDYGFIAEEVNAIIPTLTGWAKEDYDDPSSELRIESVQYDKITPYLVEAVKDLKARIETLEG